MARKIKATVETNDGAGPRDVVHCEACGRDVVIDVDGSPVGCEIDRRTKLRALVDRGKYHLQKDLTCLESALPAHCETCDFKEGEEEG
ncbi:hypothetical protein LCGC14_0446990 [marine sediment metagenome]|uniref:Uncharacterized protein n=1 Tax=marine sediment metagenome TaxID=412755 RepID=A0A0F9VT45_9ZZZZ